MTDDELPGQTSRNAYEKAHALKALNSRIAKLEIELKAEAEALREMQSSVSKKQNSLNQLLKELETMTAEPKELVVSEHAILRWVERVQGLNLEEIATQITTSVQSAWQVVGDGKFPIPGTGMTAVVKQGTIVTIH